MRNDDVIIEMYLRPSNFDLRLLLHAVGGESCSQYLGYIAIPKQNKDCKGIIIIILVGCAPDMS